MAVLLGVPTRGSAAAPTIYVSDRATVHQIDHPQAGPNVRIPDVSTVWSAHAANQGFLRHTTQWSNTGGVATDGSHAIGWSAVSGWTGPTAPGVLNGQGFVTTGREFVWLETPAGYEASFGWGIGRGAAFVVGALQEGAVNIQLGLNAGPRAVRRTFGAMWDATGKLLRKTDVTGKFVAVTPDGKTVVGCIGEAKGTPGQDGFLPCPECSHSKMRAMRWVNGVGEYLGVEGYGGCATLVNATGSTIVGGTQTGSQSYRTLASGYQWIWDSGSISLLPRIPDRDPGYYSYGSGAALCMTANGNALFGYDDGQAGGPMYAAVWRPSPTWRSPKCDVLTPGQPGWVTSCSADGRTLVGAWLFGNKWELALWREGRGLTRLSEYLANELNITADLGFGNIVDENIDPRGVVPKISGDASCITIYRWEFDNFPSRPTQLTIIRTQPTPPTPPQVAATNSTRGDDGSIRFQLTVGPGYEGCRLQRRELGGTVWESVAALTADGLEYAVEATGAGALYRIACE